MCVFERLVGTVRGCRNFRRLRPSLSNMSAHPYLDHTGPLAIAHRGGALETVENTREAFAYATEVGFRYLETDAQLTRDGVVVAFHDDEVDRVSRETGKINTWDWGDLQQLQINGTGTLISIADLLEQYPSIRFNIDAKSDEVVEPLLAVLESLEAFDRVCVGSFRDDRLRLARSAREPGEVCTSFGPRGTLRCVLSSFGLPVELPEGYALQLPTHFRGIPLLTSRLIDHAHEVGLVVHAWTIDDEAEMNRLLDLGIDGIMTDRPTLLSSVFAARGLAL